MKRPRDTSDAISGPTNEFPPHHAIRDSIHLKNRKLSQGASGKKDSDVHILSPRKMEPRLKTSIWVAALIRRAELGGASAYVARKGEADAGAVLVKVALLDGRARVWSSTYGGDGHRRWMKATGAEFVAEADADAYIARARGRDSDLWVVEIEDRQGRNFLTEPTD